MYRTFVRLLSGVVLFMVVVACSNTTPDRDAEARWHALGPEGSTVVQDDGFGVGVLPGTVDQPVSVRFVESADPGLLLPDWVEQVGEYFEIDASASVLAEPGGLFLLRVPLPEGLDTEHLALAVVSPAGFNTGTDEAAWTILHGNTNTDGTALLVGTLALISEGAVATLVTGPELYSGRSAIDQGSPVSLASTAEWPTREFAVWCHGYGEMGCPGIASDIEDMLEETASELEALGYREPVLNRRWKFVDDFRWDIVPGVEAGPFIVNLEPLQPSGKKFSCGGVDDLVGIYRSSGKITICTGEGRSSDDVLQTAFHELFHAFQHAHDRHMIARGELWIIEGQATSVQSYGSGIPMQRANRYPRRVDISLFQAGNPEDEEYRGIEYQTQDFWLYLLHSQRNPAGLQTMLSFLENGLHTGGVDRTIREHFGEYDGLAEAYWAWVRDQVFEKRLNLVQPGTDAPSLGARCILGTNLHVRGQELIVSEVVDLSFSDRASHTFALGPLTSALFEVDINVGSIPGALAELSVSHPGDLRWKIYDHYEHATDACLSTPDDTGYSIPIGEDGSPSNLYLLVSNTHLSRQTIGNVQFRLTGRDVPGGFTLSPAQVYCSDLQLPAIGLSWSASAGAAGYEVHRDGSLYAELESLGTAFQNTQNVTPGTTYSYFVRARNEHGHTDSNSVSATALACTDDPAPEGADLIVTDLTVNPVSSPSGGTMTVSFNVYNQGNQPAAASTTRIRINSNPTTVSTSDTLLRVLNTPVVAAGSSQAYSETVTLPALSDGTYYMWVTADVFNQADQSNYENDRAVTRISIGNDVIAPACSDPNQVIQFPDRNLEGAIRLEIGIPTGPIECQDMQALTRLAADDETSISNLEGLQHASSLTYLGLWGNQISDISPLANLTDLANLNLGFNQISDISPLVHLTALADLYLGGNQITDISPLANLTSLTLLGLEVNPISDISPLVNLTSLTDLSLGPSNISDISPLANLTSLTSLGLVGNSISDISPLANLASLSWLSLEGSQISDISPLANLTSLTTLGLRRSQISDISLIANLTNLTSFGLESSQVSDISPLAYLTSLADLYLGLNQINDISPLANLTNLTSLSLWHNQISDISPLIRNSGLRSGSTIDLRYNCLDLTEESPSYRDIHSLIGRGAAVDYEPQHDCQP